MAVKFLTNEWAEAFSNALNASDGFKSAISGVSMTLAYEVTDTPEGAIGYHLAIADGGASVALGEAAAADVSITSGHETAVALAKGELNPQAAFMTGKIKVAGNLAMLMMNQAVLSSFSNVGQELDVEF